MHTASLKFAGALIAILGFAFGANVASAQFFPSYGVSTATTSYHFGDVVGVGTSYQITSDGSGTPPDGGIRYFTQVLPPNLSGLIGTFVFTTSAVSISPNQLVCGMYKNGVGMGFSVSMIANGTGQLACDLSSYNTNFIATSSYSIVVTSFIDNVKFYGNTATNTISVAGYNGTVVPFDIYSTCYFDPLQTASACPSVPTFSIQFSATNASSSGLFYAPDSPAGIHMNCGITDIGGCVSNALSWAFVPSETSFEMFVTIKDDLKNKPPFGYFTSAVESLDNLEGSTTGAFALEEVTPIYDNIFAPLRTGLEWLMYFAGLVWLYKRLTNIHI